MQIATRLTALFLSLILTLTAPGLGVTQAMAATLRGSGKTASSQHLSPTVSRSLLSAPIRTNKTGLPRTAVLSALEDGTQANSDAVSADRTQEMEVAPLAEEILRWSNFFDQQQRQESSAVTADMPGSASNIAGEDSFQLQQPPLTRTFIQRLVDGLHSESLDASLKDPAKTILTNLGPEKLIGLSLEGIKAPPFESGADAGASVDKNTMFNDLGFLSNLFRAAYASQIPWKEQHLKWNLEQEIQKAKNEVQEGPATKQHYWQIHQRVIKSPADYHDSAIYDSNKTSFLSFTVKESEGHYIILWIDRQKLSKTAFPFKSGDELIKFDGRPTAEVVKELQAQLGKNDETTDHGLATFKLTSRRSSNGYDVPKGAIEIVVLPKGKTKETDQVKHELMWQHDANIITLQSSPSASQSQVDLSLANALSPIYHDLAAMEPENPHRLASRISYVPDLGPKIWESEKTDPFHAYIYTLEDKKIGYVRIASYAPKDEEKAATYFATLMELFDTETDKVVIDQVSNPGGSVFLVYDHVRALTRQAMKTPKHKIAVTSADKESSEALDMIMKLIDLKLLPASDELAQKLIGASSISGYPVTYQFLLFMVDYARSILETLAAGKTVTEPIHLYGVNQINGSPKGYSKDIIVLTDPFDFSGGDFLPAILQDNKRAKIFGAKTAGAGGFVREFKYPNSLGIKSISLTGSLAIRETEGNPPIENKAVTPDPGYEYFITADDLQNNYRGYKAAINNAVLKTLKESAAKDPPKS